METKPGQFKELVFKTSPAWTPLILRSLLAMVILPHGAQKLFGVLGGYGFEGTMQFFTETVGLPYVIGLLVIILETAGALLLLFGSGTRIVAFALTILAIGIMITSHLQNGFFMNWFGNQAGEGIEFFLLWIGISSSLIISGAGRYSVDEYIYTKKFVHSMA